MNSGYKEKFSSIRVWGSIIIKRGQLEEKKGDNEMTGVLGQSKYFTVNDGVRLHYFEAGSGKPLVMIHGWSQSAAEFKKNISELSQYYRVIAIDLRGHGESDKPNHGYRISRFAKDVFELITYLDLKDVNILGWSMGCSVIWSYWELFGSERLSKMILVDEPGWLLRTDENDLGLWTYDELVATCKNIVEDKATFTKQLIDGLLTITVSEEDTEFLIKENLKMPADYSARLAFIHWLNDWRDVIPTINIPALIIGGKKSFINWKSQVWSNEKIQGSKLEIFEERGHLMFFEEPDKFNKLVADFIG